MIMRAWFNKDSFEKEFKVRSKFTHASVNSSKFRILPYSTKNNVIQDYQALVGNFSRRLSGLDYVEFHTDAFWESVKSLVDPNESDSEKLIYIIKNMFFEGEQFKLSHPIFFNYLPAGSNEEQKVAVFLADVFENDRIREQLQQCYEKKPQNVLLSLLYDALKAMQEGKNRESKKANSKKEINECMVPAIQQCFQEDLLFLLSNEKLLMRYFERLLIFYYFIYITQLILKLNKMFDSDDIEVFPVYFYLDWEKRSANRDSYQKGWLMIRNRLSSLYAHVNCLAMINHIHVEGSNGKYEKLTYERLKDLVDELSEENRIELACEIGELIRNYQSYLLDVEWVKFKAKISKDDVLANVRTLLQSIVFQFNHSVRSKPAKEYYSGYEDLAKKYFLKRSGLLGYTLNLSQDDLIFLTKVCLKNDEKMRVKDLFKQIEKRGVFFDRETQKQAVQLYEKLNLLEKKSDSGDAQYVKNIL
jgi:DNA phosphorothioation-dependent restriction protein DptG